MSKQKGFMKQKQSDLLLRLKNYPVREYSAGTPILYQGEIPQTAYVVKSGIIKAYVISKNGDECIITFNVENDILPSAWVFGKASSNLYYYQAVSDVILHAVRRDELHQMIHSYPSLTAEVLETFVTGYTGSLMRITALEQAKAREKILFTLYYLIQRYGKEVAPGWYGIQLNLTHQSIADLVGLTRETTATELSALKKTKLLSYKRQKYLIKRDQLLRLIGEDSFRNIKV